MATDSEKSPKQSPKNREEWRPLSDAEVAEVPLPDGRVVRIDALGRVLCNAKRRDGETCKSPSVAGLSKCRMHVGSNKSAKELTRLRLADAVNPAIAKLIQLMGRAESESVQLRAADSLLDRAGYGRHQVVDGGEAKELLFQRLLSEQAAQEAEEAAETVEDYDS